MPRFGQRLSLHPSWASVWWSLCGWDERTLTTAWSCTERSTSSCVEEAAVRHTPGGWIQTRFLMRQNYGEVSYRCWFYVLVSFDNMIFIICESNKSFRNNLYYNYDCVITKHSKWSHLFVCKNRIKYNILNLRIGAYLVK